MTDGFSVLAIEKVDGRREVLGRWDSFPRFLWLRGRSVLVELGGFPSVSRKTSDIFEKISHVFSKNSHVFVRISHVFVEVQDVFCAVFVFSFGLKIVLIFCCSVKVVKAKSAKVQGCARVSHAREKTTAVWMTLGHRVMSRPR